MAADNTISLQLKVQDDGSVVLEKFQVNAQEAFRKVETASQSLLGKMKNHWVEMAAAAYGAWITISKGWNLAEEAAGYMEQMTALDNLAAKYNTTAQSIVQSIQQAANGQISQAEAAKVAAKSLMEGMNPEQLTKFMTMTTALTNATGQKVGEAFESISQALASGKTKALHQMGIIVDLNKAYDDYAAKLGVTSDHLTEHAKQVAGVDAVLKQYDATIRKLGSAPESIDDKMEKFTSRLKDIKLLLGEGIIRGAAGVIALFEFMGSVVNSAVGAVAYGVQKLFEVLAKLPGAGKYFEGMGVLAKETADQFLGASKIGLQDAINNFTLMAKIGDDAQKKAGGLKIGGGKDPLVESSASKLLEFRLQKEREAADKAAQTSNDPWLVLVQKYADQEDDLRKAAGARTVEDLRKMAQTNLGIKKAYAALDKEFEADVNAQVVKDAETAAKQSEEILKRKLENEAKMRELSGPVVSETIQINDAYLKEREQLMALYATKQELREFDVINAMEAAHKISKVEADEARNRLMLTAKTEKLIMDMKFTAAGQAVALLQALGAQGRVFAVAAIAIQKASSIAQIAMQTQVAASAALLPPPVGLGPVAGQALAAQIQTWGNISMGLVAAQGLAEMAQATGAMGGGGVSAGSAGGPPIQTSNQNNGYRYFDYQQTQYGSGWKPGEGQGPGVTINIHGDIYDKAAFDKKVINVVDQNIKDDGSTKKVIRRYM